MLKRTGSEQKHNLEQKTAENTASAKPYQPSALPQNPQDCPTQLTAFPLSELLRKGFMKRR
jgi:hypothetical protein